MFRTPYGFVRGTGIALMLAAAPLSTAYAQDLDSPDTIAAAPQLTSLSPGEFVWEPGNTSGPVEIIVSIPMQIAYVYRSGELIGTSTVSTGRPGNDTPTGRFNILQKRRTHFSNIYDNAPMPFMQRLTWDGIALHAGAIPGTPASHGCVRLPLAFARHLFSATALGATVVITDEAPANPAEGMALVRGERGIQLAGGE